MNPKIKSIFYGMLSFFILLSIVVFLVNLLAIVKENAEPNLNGAATVILSTCGVCFLIVKLVYTNVGEHLESLFESLFSKKVN